MKKETLFNKNHITITRTIYKKPVEENYFENISRHYSGYTPNFYDSYKNRRKWIPEKTITENKISPLGFTYISKTVMPGYWEYQNKEHKTAFDTDIKFLSFNEYCIYVGCESYNIIYPVSYGSNRINADARPWDIADGGMEDHYVDDLFKLLTDLVNLFSEAKVKYTPHEHKYSQWREPEKYNEEPKWDSWSLSDWKLNLFNDIFGNPKGPRFMTNNEKIISHGFDLKTSFRKM